MQEFILICSLLHWIGLSFDFFQQVFRVMVILVDGVPPPPPVVPPPVSAVIFPSTTSYVEKPGTVKVNRLVFLTTHVAQTTPSFKILGIWKLILFKIITAGLFSLGSVMVTLVL